MTAEKKRHDASDRMGLPFASLATWAREPACPDYDSFDGICWSHRSTVRRVSDVAHVNLALPSNRKFTH